MKKQVNMCLNEWREYYNTQKIMLCYQSSSLMVASSSSPRLSTASLTISPLPRSLNWLKERDMSSDKLDRRGSSYSQLASSVKALNLVDSVSDIGKKIVKSFFSGNLLRGMQDEIRVWSDIMLDLCKRKRRCKIQR